MFRQSVKSDNHESNENDVAFIKAIAELFNQLNESSLKMQVFDIVPPFDRRSSAKLTVKRSFEIVRGPSLFRISRVAIWKKKIKKELPSLSEEHIKSCHGLILKILKKIKSALGHFVMTFENKLKQDTDNAFILFCL